MLESFNSIPARLRNKFGDYVAGSIVTVVAGLLFMALVEVLVLLFPAG